jgi:hypothetical protein
LHINLASTNWNVRSGTHAYVTSFPWNQIFQYDPPSGVIRAR